MKRERIILEGTYNGQPSHTPSSSQMMEVPKDLIEKTLKTLRENHRDDEGTCVCCYHGMVTHSGTCELDERIRELEHEWYKS